MKIYTDNSRVIDGLILRNEKLEAKIAELEKTVKSLTDGVTHFNRSGGDMNPLLTAYIEALKDNN